ncbi:MAG: glycoside hydrolase family 43 protein [Prolixibacteraceae bacterium]|jgi:xylan 1,4-beta-xylosidase|nr:glycoside hydrolase family 43 protein [Prolixibacteraceae bacterium]
MGKTFFSTIAIAILFLFACSSKSNSISKTIIPETYENPILRGFYPDPSICKVNDDYYMVNSSFEWFPGVPIFQSKDLVNWKQIGHVLDRPGQLQITEGMAASRGIFAPTLRYHEGLFYMISTCVACNGNFFVTAENPAGPWSDPVWINTPGIDPTFFWDDDGTCWYIGAHNISGKREWDGQNGVFIQQFDLEKKELIGEPVQATFGHATNAVWGEGPHVYKIDGRYLLMIAEGGTSYDHAITVFESDKINGKYVPSTINPVLTHRHLGHNYPIFAVGHCDFVQTQNNEWWAVMLAVRTCDGMNLLGRETYLVPMEFENSWPLFNRGVGKVQFEEQRPNLPWTPVVQYPVRDEFENGELAMKWVFLRTPYENWYEIADSKITIDLRPQMMTKLEQPSLVAQRITEFNFEAFTKVNFKANADNEEAGFVAIYNNMRNFRLVKTSVNGKSMVQLIRVKVGQEKLVATKSVDEEEIVLGVKANNLKYQFYFGKDKASLKPIGDVQDATVNASQSGIDFTGPMVGFYASSNGLQSTNKAVFDWFEYNDLR